MGVNKQNVRVYISNIIRNLGENDRRIAAFILENAGVFVQLPVKKLSLALQISEATIVRFCKKIGYGGLLDLKGALKKELLQDSDLALPVSPDIFLDDSRFEVAKKIGLTIEQTVKETVDLLDMQKSKAIVDWFIRARRVMFVGFGASGLAAMEARDKMNRIGIDSEAFTDRFTMTLKLANLKADDLVVAFSHSGETPEVVNAFRLARKAQACCLAITHRTRSPLTELCDGFLLTCGESERYQGDSIGTRVSQLFMIEFLCTEITRQSYQGRGSPGVSIKELLIKERIKREES
ncbi:MurR/RpiR family transcriptional regulator [Serratia entomophila]|uniref:MurR/RpiR family transcriptional regulator n=1 Tax=Serratia entomophila TaxID=42906 RepID=UPI0021777815|nr:MurR/RpiR family transcriptional regulator [Serratia entomophila]CAI1040120.1 Uncharacterized HTH-type transcriptional regulator ybbH [Serratia entomophila]CAI1719217.1 Uncharacterized HTH-type transcriptional regulator ybbH [Serratia entomophila]CAI1783131.1 Uncharacterized HTH-type transcriptional regulator ybbH [Serratia entomophila]CAI1837334.1 Uncharacterized HTH-type transcriptional regulator ybbH [Serratia entomophila]CAI1848140.1 Uncharacterized HTH-type transcriptional regulator yb